MYKTFEGKPDSSYLESMPDVAILAKHPYEDSTTAVIFVPMGDSLIPDVETTLKMNGYKNIRHMAKTAVRWQKTTSYQCIDYNTLEDKYAYNALQYLRDNITPETIVYAVSVYNKPGSYRWQHYVKVFIIKDNKLETITSYIPGDYDSNYGGIHCDTADYVDDIRTKIYRVVRFRPKVSSL